MRRALERGNQGQEGGPRARLQAQGGSHLGRRGHAREGGAWPAIERNQGPSRGPRREGGTRDRGSPAVRVASHPRLKDAKRAVIKIGSALLVDKESGALRQAWLDSLADDVARMRTHGQEVLLVSSGAIALGRRQLAITGRKRKLTLEEKQAAASVGQIGLAHAYQESFARHGLAISQILVTLRDT